jgi:hypothetical protein
MQMTINVPDNLPPAIVQQYIHNVESQMTLMAQLTQDFNKKIERKNVVSLKRGSAKNIITFMADDFNAPLADFEDYML